MSQLYNVSLSPHIRAKDTTRGIMLDVLIALLPPMATGVYIFGIRALFITLLSVASCVGWELLYEKLLGLKVTVGDLSAAVTGMILAMNLYSSAPWWLPVLGGGFAVVVVKCLFGGLGQNFMNPALAARCFLLISFPKLMTAYPAVDGVSGATPLAVIKDGGSVPLMTLLIGNHSGTIGETSALAILIGALYLIIRGVIRIRIPAVVILSSALFIAGFGFIKGDAVTPELILSHILGGGLLAGAVFMATDYVTAPVTGWGQVIYAALIGFLTAFIRLFGGSAEGMSYAIIISNLLTPLIEKLTAPRPFGLEKKEAAR